MESKVGRDIANTQASLGVRGIDERAPGNAIWLTKSAIKLLIKSKDVFCRAVWMIIECK
jgi:hypothetical protein